MKKRFLLINTIVSFISLSILLIAVSLIISNQNKKDIESNMSTYLNVLSKSYDGDNEEEAAKLITDSNKTVRITFISIDGEVLYDNIKVSEENHLNRPEIEHIGSFNYRHSDTLKNDYLYCAILSHNTYIRVAIISNDINSTVYKIIFSGFGVLLVIFLATLLFDNLYYKKMMKPLNKEIDKLNEIVGDKEPNNIDDINVLSLQIDKVHFLINDKINSLINETNKLNYIIEHMNQGILIIDGSSQIMLCNSLALSILEYKRNDFIGKDYNLILTNNILNEYISLSFTEDTNKYLIFNQGEKTFSYTVLSLKDSFASKYNRNGVAIFIRDITELKKIEKMKSDFFQNASHELKSPLTTILGYQQMIDAGVITDKEEIQSATKNTIKEAKRINNIIIEMLDLSRLETNSHEDDEVNSIYDTIDSIANLYNPLLSEKNITLKYDFEDFHIKMSNENLNHLFRNLIENAIKYNKNDGTINIYSEGHKLYIKDSGIGIPSDDLERIFERFYRVDKAHSRELGGTGLGLAIVKHICINYNIKINVSSELNVGTTFELDFDKIYTEE